MGREGGPAAGERDGLEGKTELWSYLFISWRNKPSAGGYDRSRHNNMIYVLQLL